MLTLFRLNNIFDTCWHLGGMYSKPMNNFREQRTVLHLPSTKYRKRPAARGFCQHKLIDLDQQQRVISHQSSVISHQSSVIRPDLICVLCPGSDPILSLLSTVCCVSSLLLFGVCCVLCAEFWIKFLFESWINILCLPLSVSHTPYPILLPYLTL
jgi:hypothetical protein